MKKEKQINCRDGLDKKQEIRARRIKDQLLDENQKKIYFVRLRFLYYELCSLKNRQAQLKEYEEYLIKTDIALYWACKRANINLSRFIE